MKLVSYGGQAVIEGVMMRGSRRVAIAMRKPSGEITVHSEALPQGIYGALGRLPFVRGLVMLWDALILGTRALMLSADIALEEDDVKMSGPAMWGTIATSLLFAVGLFVVLPMALVGLTDRFITSPLLSNLAEGLTRLAFFVAYLVAINRMPDIRRVFAYHGAEHKTINAYESGASLTPDSVAAYSRAHTRCGTGFMLVVLILFVLISSFLGRPSLALRLASRVVLIPIVSGIAYEIIKFSARHYERSRLVRAIMAPGLVLQQLTIREPSADMLEVAFASLKTVLAPEGLLEPDREAAPDAAQIGAALPEA